MRPDDITPEEHDEARMMLTPDGDECRAALVAQNALRDERVRAAERERLAREIEAQAKAARYGTASRLALLDVARRVREGGDTNG